VPSLEVQNLRVSYGPVEILRGIDLSLDAGETLGIVGESGCGKSMTGLAIMGMVPRPGVVAGEIRFRGQNLVGQSEKQWQELRGDRIAMVMQDPFSSLNPIMRVGEQIAEVFRLHQGMGKAEAWDQAVRMMDRVGIPDPAASARKYPHQMSGGQRQRVVIGIAFAGKPDVLVADEPTTALDVTIQAQVLELLKELQNEHGTAVVFISHDIGVIAQISDRIAVFYAGLVVETGPTLDVIRSPRHPYTQALLGAVPRVGADRLDSIGGQPPRFDAMPPGCAFQPRCPRAFAKCGEPPVLESQGPRACACWASSGRTDQPLRPSNGGAPE